MGGKNRYILNDKSAACDNKIKPFENSNVMKRELLVVIKKKHKHESDKTQKKKGKRALL